MVAGSDVDTADSLHILGVTLDSTLSLDQHVTSTVRACNNHLQALRHVRQSITHDVANTMACAIIGCRLDYCNSFSWHVTEKFQ